MSATDSESCYSREPLKLQVNLTEGEIIVLAYALADSIVYERERAEKLNQGDRDYVINKCEARQRLLDRFHNILSD